MLLGASFTSKKLPQGRQVGGDERGAYGVSVRDARYEYLNPQGVAPPPTLPAPADAHDGKRQLEGPPEKDAV
jgi:hypothetical protein